MLPDITIIVPTYQRPDHIKKKMLHFSSIDCSIPIEVWDTSDSSVIKKNKETIKKYKEKLSLSYFSLPQSYSFISKIYKAVRETKTQYVIIHPDDDFLNIHSVIKCVEFLEKKKDYVFATGVTLGYRRENEERGDFLTLYIKNDIISDSDVFTRIHHCRSTNRGKIPFQNVWRQDIFLKVLEPIASTPYVKYSEYMINFLAAAAGRGALLDCLHEIRIPDAQKSIRRKTSVLGFENTRESWFSGKNFINDLPIFLDRCCDFILEQSPQSSVENVRNSILVSYIAKAFEVDLFTAKKTMGFIGAKRIFFNVLRYLGYLPSLFSFRKFKLLFLMLRSYGYSRTGHMLRYDLAFKYNVYVLRNEKGNNSIAFRAMESAFKNKG